jgi:outer membrane receptor protein involved in Fe transport
LQEKIIAKTQLYIYSQMDATGNVSDTKVIPGAVDWSFELEYRFNNKWGVFTRLNNLLDTRYYRWDTRPSYRFNFIVGATFSL